MQTSKNILAVEKRGGRRHPVKRKSKNADFLSPRDYYKDRKGTGIFPKRLPQYRFLICTDLETDDELALAMFTAWVKTNEQFFDSRNGFPIYGFVVGETHNKRTKAQRAREFLKRFGDILSWDDEEHHLYKGYVAAGTRVWVGGLGNSEGPWDNENELVTHPEALESEDYPNPELFITAIDELIKVKSSNLFILYLKPLHFFQSIQNRPEVIEYLRKVPGAMCGANVLESPELLQFINRTRSDAPLLYTEMHLTMCVDDAPKLFRELDDAEDDELAAVINKTMYCWNDNLLSQYITKLQDLPEFKETDFDDYKSFTRDCKRLALRNSVYEGNTSCFPSPEKLKVIIKVVDSIMKYNSRQFTCADPLVIIAILIATGTLTKTPFRLQRSTVSYTGSVENDESNTHVLLPVCGIKKQKHLLERMLLAAFTITTDE
uniref:Uncharacterized protein n=1 Tax=Marseillevirus LCMAC201 TaxID=2506605 RepID=A0A481YVB4_9VIRU|nr:MAG: hypothetical protein LCMAC201_00040 [Marseillevirus LCMAC201]